MWKLQINEQIGTNWKMKQNSHLQEVSTLLILHCTNSRVSFFISKKCAVNFCIIYGFLVHVLLTTHYYYAFCCSVFFLGGNFNGMPTTRCCH